MTNLGLNSVTPYDTLGLLVVILEHRGRHKACAWLGVSKDLIPPQKIKEQRNIVGSLLYSSATDINKSDTVFSTVYSNVNENKT